MRVSITELKNCLSAVADSDDENVVVELTRQGFLGEKTELYEIELVRNSRSYKSVRIILGKRVS